MATPLEFKKRVHLPDEPWLPATGRQRRAPLRLLAAASWLGLAVFCYSVATGAVPLARWLGGVRAPLVQRAAESGPAPVRAQAVSPAGVDRADEAVPSPAEASSAIEPAPGAGSALAPATVAPPATHLPVGDSRGIDPFAAGDGFGDSARDTGEATVDDAPTMATSSGIGRTSCELAIAKEEDRTGAVGAAHRASPPIAAIVDSGRWFSGCGSVQRFEVHLCVAVRNGRAVGVTVHTLPAHRDIVRCIANQAWGLSFPKSPQLGVERASFSPG